MQLPLPKGPDSVSVPVPAIFEQWRDFYLHGALQKLLVLVLVALLLFLLARVLRRQVDRWIEDVNRRHAVRKGVGYATAVLLALFGVALFADVLTGLGTVLAVLLAGVAVALQDILKSIVGWLYLSSRSGFSIGSRVEVGGVMGDVIDVGVLKTTMLEVGNLVYGLQASGRLVTVPNYRMLSEAVIVSGEDNPFVWHEVKLTVTFESDWQRAEEIMRRAGESLHENIAPELEAGFRRLERRYAFKYGTLTPIVYANFAVHGVDLVLRYLTPVRHRRGSEDRVTRRILTDLRGEPNVAIAYPAHRIFRPSDGWLGAGPPPSPAAPQPGGGEEGLPPPDLVD